MVAMEKVKEVNHILSVAMEAGKIMLENGAEIYRVEDTMERIAKHYGSTDHHFFVLTNGIFVSGEDKDGSAFSKLEHIPVHGADLSKVIAINQLSREIAQDKYTLEEAASKIDEIRNIKNKSWLLQVFATALGSGCFAILLDGTMRDGIASFISGIALGFFIYFVFKPYLSKITGNIVGAMIISAICVLFKELGFADSLIPMIGGGVIPLVPGVAFVNGIRDIGDEDYISGAVRLLDAMLVFVCIAVGVATILICYEKIVGGVLL